MCIKSTCSYQLLEDKYIIIDWNEKDYYLRFEKNIVVCIFIVPKSWLNLSRLISKLPINHSCHMCFYSIIHIFSCSMPHHFHWKYCGERKLASRDYFFLLCHKLDWIWWWNVKDQYLTSPKMIVVIYVSILLVTYCLTGFRTSFLEQLTMNVN